MSYRLQFGAHWRASGPWGQSVGEVSVVVRLDIDTWLHRGAGAPDLDYKMDGSHKKVNNASRKRVDNIVPLR